jgi:hypothetical protein
MMVDSKAFKRYIHMKEIKTLNSNAYFIRNSNYHPEDTFHIAWLKASVCNICVNVMQF